MYSILQNILAPFSNYFGVISKYVWNHHGVILETVCPSSDTCDQFISRQIQKDSTQTQNIPNAFKNTKAYNASQTE